MLGKLISSHVETTVSHSLPNMEEMALALEPNELKIPGRLALVSGMRTKGSLLSTCMSQRTAPEGTQ